MALQFYIGGSGAGKSNKLFQDIINESLEKPHTNFLIIVPDQFTMQTQKELVCMHPRGGIMNIDVLSFGRLTHRILEETGLLDKPVLDDTGKSLVLRRLAGQFRNQLTVIGSNLKKTGYVHEVKSAISEFMQYGIRPGQVEELADYAKSRGSLYYKLKDLQVLYGAFEEYIRGKFVTTEGRLGLLYEALPQSAIVKGSVIAFDGFTGFTPIQNQVIRRLLELAAEVKCSLLLDAAEDWREESGEQHLFALSKKTLRSLTKLAEEAGTEIKSPVILKGSPVLRFRENPALSHLEQELFRFRSRAYEKETDRIHVAEVSAPREEVRQICLQIRRLVREEGYQYRDIGIIAGDLAVYAGDVEEEFDRFGIPCFVDSTRGVALNPFIEYIRSGLQIVLKNFSYEAVFHFLRSGLSGLAEEEIDRLENYVLAAGIRGRTSWSRLFARRTKTLAGEEELEAINRLRQAVMDKLSPLLKTGETVADYGNNLYDFIVENRVAERLAVYERQFTEASQLAQAREYAQIYRLVMELLEQIVELIGAEAMTLQEFADILDAGFGEIQVGTIPQNVDKVVVGDMERTRLQKIKVLFLMGVNDGNIPRNAGGGGLISDLDREFLREGAFELSPTPRQQMYIQRLYLYMNMTKPSDCLYLSYVRVNGAGKALRPSYLIDAVRRLFPRLTVEMPEKRRLPEQLEVAQDGFEALAGELERYARGGTGQEDGAALFTLYRLYVEEETWRGELKRLLEAAFSRYEPLPLSRAAARALYGAELVNSVSRLETYAACACQYFLKYGLSLQEREEYGFEDVDMGNVFHSVLEQFAGRLTERGRTWFDFTKEEGESMVEEAVDACAAVYKDTVLFSSARNVYAVTRMKRILKRTVDTLQRQLKRGRFQPDKFEVSFAKEETLDAVNIALGGGECMRLLGRIDRVDICQREDAVYVKVIDYKSGHRKLDIAAVYYGLQLQLVVYLNAALELVQREHKGKEAHPAAVLYYHIADPMVRAESGQIPPEQLAEQLREELKMTGLVNEKEEVVRLLDADFSDKSQVIPVERKKDGSFSARSSTLPEEDLQRISDYVNQKIGLLGRQIVEGQIAKNPYEYGQDKACTYCAYQKVCGFDKKIPGCRTRALAAMKPEEALAAMKPQKEGE